MGAVYLRWQDHLSSQVFPEAVSQSDLVYWAKEAPQRSTTEILRTVSGFLVLYHTLFKALSKIINKL